MPVLSGYAASKLQIAVAIRADIVVPWCAARRLGRGTAEAVIAGRVRLDRVTTDITRDAEGEGFETAEFHDVRPGQDGG